MLLPMSTGPGARPEGEPALGSEDGMLGSGPVTHPSGQPPRLKCHFFSNEGKVFPPGKYLQIHL